MEKVIVDTGALYALVDRNDKWHKKVKEFVEENNPTLIVPCSILPEVCYLINKYLGQETEVNFLDALINSDVLIVDISPKDIKTALRYMTRYKDRNLGFVDASLLALSERLNIYHILTVDRRDFSGIKVKGKLLKLYP